MHLSVCSSSFSIISACIVCFTSFVFNASLLLIDYGYPVLMSKLAFLAARRGAARLFIIL